MLGVSNFEEDSFVDETPEMIAKYIIDQLLASVIEPVGRCHGAFMFVHLLKHVNLTLHSAALVFILVSNDSIPVFHRQLLV